MLSAYMIHHGVAAVVFMIPATGMCAWCDCESVFYMQNAAVGICATDDNQAHCRV